MSFCSISVEETFYSSHLLDHFDYQPFVCNFPNCTAKYQTELQLNLHFSIKHKERLQKMTILSYKKIDQISQICNAKCSLIDDDQMLQKILAKYRNLLWNLDMQRLNLSASKMQMPKTRSVRAKKHHYNDYMRWNRNYIQCQKCDKHVTDRQFNKQQHSLMHFVNENSETKIWLYKCLWCRQFKTLWLSSLYAHLRASHKILDKPKLDQHYCSRIDEFADDIKIVGEVCFANSHKIQKKPLSNNENAKTEHKKKIRDENKKGRSTRFKLLTCSKCGLSTRGKNIQLKQHCLSHLMEKGKIDWPYECLLCHNAKYTNEKSIQSHISLTHKIKKIERGNHYLDRTALSAELIRDSIQSCFDLQYNIKKWSENSCAIEKVRQPHKNAKNFKRVDCVLCSKNSSISIRWQCLKHHSLLHINSELGIDWLYSCMMCPESQQFKTIHQYSMQVHLKRTHKVKQPECHEHYEDQSRKHEKSINALVKKCFPAAFN